MAETPRFELSTYEKAQKQLRDNNIQVSPGLDQQITDTKKVSAEQRLKLNTEIVENSYNGLTPAPKVEAKPDAKPAPKVEAPALSSLETLQVLITKSIEDLKKWSKEYPLKTEKQIEKYTGKATFVYENGNVYVWDVKSGIFDGIGMTLLANWDKHIGKYSSDSKNGQGIYIWKNRDKYDGNFLEGNLHGKWKETHVDWFTTNWDYLNDMFIKWTKTWSDGYQEKWEWYDDGKRKNGVSYYIKDSTIKMAEWSTDNNSSIGYIRHKDGTIEAWNFDKEGKLQNGLVTSTDGTVLKEVLNGNRSDVLFWTTFLAPAADKAYDEGMKTWKKYNHLLPKK